jgi:hypothetical protein
VNTYMAIRLLTRYSGGLSIYYRQNLSKHIEIIKKIQKGMLWLKLSKCYLILRKMYTFVLFIYHQLPQSLLIQVILIFFF